MKKNTLEDYKEAVKAKYEEEKSGYYGSFLINPSRAKLRDLCITIFKENRKIDDLISFSSFFYFDFKEENIKELKKQTDKFRPLETFFKGETDLTDINGVDLAAVLVNFNPRPLRRFLKENSSVSISEKDSVPAPVIENENTEFVPQKQIKTTSVSNFIPNNVVNRIDKSKTEKRKQKTIWTAIGILVLFSVVYTFKDLFFPEKECMQWQNDHYEAIDCPDKNLGIGKFKFIEVLNENVLTLKKMKINKNTIFFKNDKPVVWYCKRNGNVEFFNSFGYHPETGKPLKPVTHYIINKYVRK